MRRCLKLALPNVVWLGLMVLVGLFWYGMAQATHADMPGLYGGSGLAAAVGVVGFTLMILGMLPQAVGITMPLIGASIVSPVWKRRSWLHWDSASPSLGSWCLVASLVVATLGCWVAGYGPTQLWGAAFSC